jgi:protein-disulfide isomerase
MKESTKKKKTTSVSESTDSQTKAVSSDSSTTTLLLVVILVLGVVQLVLIALSSGGGSGLSAEAEAKIDRLDSFFASNAPGYGDGSLVPSESGQVAPTVAPQVGEPDITNRPFLGSADAPITIVEYSDFECPFCARFYSDAYQQLKDTYIANGQVKLVYKDFALSFHQLAEPAGIATKCVFREVGNDAFFALHDTIFENQQALSTANLRVWALETGISESVYDSCIEDPEVVAQVQADFAEGQSFGVSGTPSFVINGQLLVGAQPFSAFEQVIDAELAK